MARIQGLVQEGGGGSFTGRGKVLECYTIVEKPEAKEGSDYKPEKTLNWLMVVQPMGVDGQPLMEEPRTIRASLGKKWADPKGQHPFHYAVGDSGALGRNNLDPVLVGVEVGHRGNTIWTPDNSGRPKGTAFDRLFESFAKFIPQKAVDAMECNEFVGMEADFIRQEETIKNGPQAGTKWGWPEVTAVISMPNCPDFPHANGAVRPAPAPVAATPVRPVGPVNPATIARPVNPATIAHTPVAHTPVAAPAAPAGGLVLLFNTLVACANAGAFNPGAVYSNETLFGAMTPKIMMEPTVGGASPAERVQKMQAIRGMMFDAATWQQFTTEAANATGGRLMSMGDGTVCFAG